MTLALKTLRAMEFNWTRALREVWNDPPYHVDDLNKASVETIIDEFVATTREPASNPIGQVIQGRAGTGKTHLIGTLRRRLWEMNGWFVLVDIIGVVDFWKTVAQSFVDSLHQRLPSGQHQHKAVLGDVLGRLFRDEKARRAIRDGPKSPLTKQRAAELYLAMLGEFDPVNAYKHRDVVRALIFLDSPEPDESDFAQMWLRGDNVDDDRRRNLGFLRAFSEPAENVRGLLWIMSLSGPTMIAFDQVDAIVGAANVSRDTAADETDAEWRKARSLIDRLALGLIDLHDVKRRAMVVVSCLEPTWKILSETAIEPFRDRFTVLATLSPVGEAKIVEQLIAERVGRASAAVGYALPYATWPFRRDAIESAVGLRPRQILMRCQDHRRACLSAGEVRECRSLAELHAPPSPSQLPSGLDAIFAKEIAAADPSLFGRAEAADAERLVHVCELFLGQLDLPDSIDGEVKPDANRKAPALHAALSFVFHDQGDRQQRWCFRWLAHDNATAFQARLKAAITAAGIDRALKFRHLIILRDAPPPKGPKTQELVEQFLKAGGRFVSLSEQDRRTFLALVALSERQLPEFETWLRARKPLFETSLFQQADLAPPAFLASAAPNPPPAPVTPAKPEPPKANEPAPEKPRPAKEREIAVGRRLERGGLGAAQTLALDLLPRHVAILAGPGSGKTVLLRRLIEEAALLGIPSLVLDVNNDLARLALPWPQRPALFTEEDAAKAEALQRRAEVVIWTPGVSGGNPMSLALLPDFAAIGAGRDAETEDEREQAVQMAVATLGPSVTGLGQKAQLKQAVLTEALRAFARGGGGSVDDFLARLADFDDQDSKINDAGKLARDLADQLNALITTNPLTKDGAPAVNPAALFQGASGKTRISVVNISGLASDTAKQAFVNRLNMALFAWIKQHPSPTGRLYVLDEAQNYAPSQGKTACSQSTRSLAAQARKYGLGMMFATQQPRGIDNALISNATTHFYGRVSAPATIQAIQEMAAAKGGETDDIGRLGKGEFYFATEGVARPVKLRTPLCLTWHPANPPASEEIAALARDHRPGG